MRDQLARLGPGRAEAHAVDDVVQPRFEQPQQILSRRTFALRRHAEIALKLTLEHPVGSAQLLLLAQLLAVVRHPHPRLHTVLTGLGVQLALGVERPAGAFQKKVGAFSPRQLAFGSVFSNHFFFSVHPRTLLRAAAVVLSLWY